MKNANKLYAAGGGLLIAALMGFGTSFADDGTQNALEAGVEPIEVSTEAVPQGDDAFSLGDETAKPGDATQTATPTETPSAEPTEPATNTPKPEAEEPAAAEPTENAESTPVEADETEPAGSRAAADTAESEVRGMPSESVNYVRARRSMVTSFSAAPMRPSPRAMAPMLTTESPYAQASYSSNHSNGDSQIIFFDLPEAAGPGLMPGAATPLLGTGISEFAPVNTNIVAPAAVQAASARYQGSAAPAAAVGQSGNLSRSLARTGSVAQYASMLSIAALIIGVSMMGAAFATTRRRNMVDVD